MRAPTAYVDQYHEEVKVQEGKAKRLDTNHVWTRRSILAKTKTLKAIKTCCSQISWAKHTCLEASWPRTRAAQPKGRTSRGYTGIDELSELCRRIKPLKDATPRAIPA